MDMLRGKKSYIIAVLMMVVGIINVATGDASAMQGILDNAMILLGGPGMMALRAGISNG
jgi:hypothetical protein